MIASSPRDRRRALGAFLKARRARLAPTALGLAAGQRRRTPGLRREEIAQLSGLSATWYTWIEQGRDVSPSPEALARLARVLQLAPAERTYLFDLAGRRDPEASIRPAAADPPPALAAALKAIAGPTYALDRAWNAIAWNPAAQRLFTGWLDQPRRAGAPNLLRFVFLDPKARALIRPWEERARRVLAEFRAESGAYPDDPGVKTLIDELRRGSALFDRFWKDHVVLGREGGRRAFHHPSRGCVTFEQVTFALVGRPDLKLVMLIPEDARAGPKLQRGARAAGTH
jgi:transcriptional regulator with XRE-family HTH domain